jgi:hypothetical protein
MILPTKYKNFSQSLLGLAGILLQLLRSPKTLDELWVEFQILNDSSSMPAFHSFEDFVLALDFLFVAGTISSGHNGEIKVEAY